MMRESPWSNRPFWKSTQEHGASYSWEGQRPISAQCHHKVVSQSQALEPTAPFRVETYFVTQEGYPSTASVWVGKFWRVTTKRSGLITTASEDNILPACRLAGYQVLKGHRVFLDYPKRGFALMDAKESRPTVDVHEWFLRRSDTAQDSIERVKALLFLGRKDDAIRKLEKLAKHPTKHPAAVAMLSRNHRANGSADSAHDLLSGLSIRDLVEHGEIVAWVNGLWLQGETEKARNQAHLATVLSPSSSQSWISLSDVSMATGQAGSARMAIAEAVRIDGDPDAHLLRRAFIASLDGDQDGAMTHFRRAIQLQPRVGYAHWLYAFLASDADRTVLIKEDLVRAESKLHPGDGPLDFWAGSWARLEDMERAERYLHEGLQRDCSRARHPQSAELYGLVPRAGPTRPQ